jgi:hypothetical protein
MNKTMDETLQRVSSVEGHAKRAPLTRGLGWGFLGGLAGTMIMDLVLMGAFSAFGSPATTCFSMVGNTVGQFFLLTGVDMARSIQLGILTHYLVGPLIGAIFGAIVARAEVLRMSPLKKTILVAIVYVEILSQPMLATTPILLKMTVPATLEWYGGSFLVHLIVAVILGAVVGYGLQREPAFRSKPGHIHNIERS